MLKKKQGELFDKDKRKCTGLNKYLIKLKRFIHKLIGRNKQIEEYKKIKWIIKEERVPWGKKLSSIPKKDRERNKYNIQLKLNFNWKKIKKTFYMLIVIFFLVLVLLIKGPFFKIENINIIKLDENVNSGLIEKKLNNLKWKLLFSVKTNIIEDIIRNTEQNIKNISITKIPPSTINIRLSSYSPIFKTIFNESRYLITENWVYLPTKWKNEKYGNIKIKWLELQNYPNYRKILQTNKIDKIKYLENKLKDNIVNLIINDIIYYKTSREVHFIINNKTRIIFNIEWNLEEKLKQIFVFSKEKINITKPGIIYIDNRIKSKIFYCPETEIKRCIENLNYIYSEKLKLSDYNTKTITK